MFTLTVICLAAAIVDWILIVLFKVFNTFLGLASTVWLVSCVLDHAANYLTYPAYV